MKKPQTLDEIIEKSQQILLANLGINLRAESVIKAAVWISPLDEQREHIKRGVEKLIAEAVEQARAEDK